MGSRREMNSIMHKVLYILHLLIFLVLAGINGFAQKTGYNRDLLLNANGIDSTNRKTYKGHYDDYVAALGMRIYRGEPLLIPSYEEMSEAWDKIQLPTGCYQKELYVDFVKKLLTLSYYEYLHEYDSMMLKVNQIYGLLKEHPECGTSIDSADLQMYEGIYLTQHNDTLAKNKLYSAIRGHEIVGDTNLAYYYLGLYYYMIESKYEEAREAFRVYENKLRRTNEDWYRHYSLRNYCGLCALHTGNTLNAIYNFEVAASSSRAVFGEMNPIYCSALHNMSLYYSHVADYNKALQYGMKAAEITEQLYGEQSEYYANELANLGERYLNNSMGDSAISCLIRSAAIYENHNGELSPKLLYPYGQLLKQFASRGRWDEMDTLINKAVKIILTNNLWRTPVSANYALALGQARIIRKDPRSYNNIGHYLYVNDSLGKRTTDDYFKGEAWFQLSTFLLDKPNNPNRNIRLLWGLYDVQYWSNNKYLVHTDRESILTSREYNLYKDLIFSLHEYDTTNTTLYNFIMLNKGLLLATAVDYAKKIYESGDTTLINRYDNLRRRLKQSDVNELYSEEYAKLRQEEREVTYLVSGINTKDYTEYTYDSVRAALGKNEVMVEYVAYNDFNGLKDDDVVRRYAALVLRGDMDAPQFVPLCTADEIEPLVHGNPDVVYDGGEVSERIIDLVWNPIMEYVHKGDKVWFSPDGCLYKLALENIPDRKGKTLGKRYKMNRCSSSRQICDKTAEKSYRNAVLYGGLVYDMDEQSMRNSSRNYSSSESRGYIPAFEANDGTRKGWSYLPGTKQEVDDIMSILKKNKIDYKYFSGEDGNEESFKALSGTDVSILHIATHGFYLPENQAEKVELISQPRWMNDKSLIEKALRRSGLMMSGGNCAWSLGHGIEGIEDGVLTAQEISRMNLTSVDLLVLSACETGLGDVANEGVFGLQWAFKNAGVGTIVMSLWEVDDNATALMMKTFYRLLTQGKKKREAFEAAQNTVREKYNNPRQWAAFIMLD